MSVPQSLFYSAQHLWAKLVADDVWEAGVTDYAQNLLGDVVFIDAPAVGSQLEAGKPCGLIESVKTGSDLHALVDGEVVEVNQAVIDSPERVNDNPYQAWIFRFKTQDQRVQDKLLTAAAYSALTDRV